MVRKSGTEYLYMGTSSLLVTALATTNDQEANDDRNVGFLRYWTLSNVPLFLLAAPVLYFMTSSALWTSALHGNVSNPSAKDSAFTNAEPCWVSPIGMAVARRLAVPQFVLGLIALTTYHVQVVTRISSGYPLWYWWLASRIVDQRPVRLGKWDIPMKTVVRWMVLYAFIQAGLFAAFLPPA